MAASRACREGSKGCNWWCANSHKLKITTSQPRERPQRLGPARPRAIREPFSATRARATHPWPPDPTDPTTHCIMHGMVAPKPQGASRSLPRAPRYPECTHQPWACDTRVSGKWCRLVCHQALCLHLLCHLGTGCPALPLQRKAEAVPVSMRWDSRRRITGFSSRDATRTFCPAS